MISRLTILTGAMSVVLFAAGCPSETPRPRGDSVLVLDGAPPYGDGATRDGTPHDGTPGNHAPTATNDDATTTENLPVTLDVLANDTDSDGDALSVKAAGKPAHGTTTVSAAKKVTYQPDPGYTGKDTFDYTVTDAHGGEAHATVSLSITASGKSYYVATAGKDENPGTAAAPFATLEAARDAIRKGGALPSGGVTVWIRGGVYALTQSFSLTDKDVGSPQTPIVYRGFPSETARITGAKRLDGKTFKLLTSAVGVWSRLDASAQGHVLAMNVSQITTAYGELSERGMGGWSGKVAHAELFFNHKPMQLARWPDADATDPFVTIDKALSDTRFTYTGDRPKRWSHAKDVWFHGYWARMWADRYAHPTTIDTATRSVTLSSKPGYGITGGQPYYAVNLLEEITQPGEWYLDRSTGFLYFWPPSSLTAPDAEVFLSTLDKPLITMKDASWVRFFHLTLEMGRDSLVTISGGEHNTLDHCVLRNAGRVGVRISGGHDNGVARCEITETGEDGVRLDGGDRKSLTLAHNYVRNSHLHRFSRWVWTYTPAVRMAGAGNIVEHNLMEDAPHTAILFTGNEHLVQYNEIHHVLRWSSDAGAIYIGRDWGYRNNQILFNFIHDVDSSFKGYGTHGIYLDDCVSGITVRGNVLYRISGYGIEAGGGRDTTMVNNLIARCGNALSADSRGITRITHDGSSWDMLKKLNDMSYQKEPWKSAYPRLAVMPNDWSTLKDTSKKWLYPEGCIFSRNVGFANGHWTHESNYGGTGSLNKYKEVKDNIEDKDPHFVDEKNGDLSLASDSPANALPGFKPIPFHDIGIQPE